MKNTHKRTPSSATLTRIARRRLVVRVHPLALAAALALGAHSPVVLAQTIITPLLGAGQTATVVSTQGNQTTVSTQSLRDGNAFSTYSSFQVGQGDVVKLAVPQGANWWVNIVRDQRVRVDGRLESRLFDGSIGGNILFVDSHGFAVGPSGEVDVGRLTFAAPSTSFVDGLLAGGLLSGQAVDGLLAGQFERSASGAVDIQGRVSARDGVSLMAGAGSGAEHAVRLAGQVVVQGRVAGSAVNLGDLTSLTPLQDRDGVIDITTPGSISLDGVLISDSAHWRQAGAVRVVAGQDIAVGASAQVSASGAAGSGAAGGQVVLFAQRDIANTPDAMLRVRGDGAGAGGAIEYSGLRNLSLSGMRFDAGSDTGTSGLVFVDPVNATLQGTTLTGGAHFEYAGSDSLTVKTGALINTRKVASGQDATNASVASTGDSGNIVLTAPHIVVEAGALLDASVVNTGGSAFEAGNIRLLAENSADWITLLGLANADASIDVAGRLQGGNVTLRASVTASAVYDGVSAALTEKGLSLLAESLGSPLALSLAYTEATGNATVTVRETAELNATHQLTLSASADRAAGAELQVGGSSQANLSAGFARVAGTTAVDVASGARLTAGGDIALVAASKTSIGMTSAAAGETDEESGAANVASVVFAGSLSDVTTRVGVDAGAVLTSGGHTELQAFHAGQYETSAEVTVYGGGTAGVVGALSLQKSETVATLNGTVNAAGDVRVMAMNASAKNSISATSEVAQQAPEDPPVVLPESLELSNDDAKQQLQMGFLSMAEALAEDAEEASGGTGSAGASKPPALKLAGALTWSTSDHTTRAQVGAGGHINAGGDAVVDAQTLVGQLQSVALSEATSETEGEDGAKRALSVAVNYADHRVTTRAEVGAGAQLTGGHVAVHASTNIPEFYTNGLPLDWSNFYSAYANLVGGTGFLLDGFNTRVGATAAGKDLAAAGAVNLSFMRNDTRAWVDTGAHISTTVGDGVPWSYAVKEVGFDSDLVAMLIPINSYSLDKDLGVFGDFVSDSRDAPSGPKLDEINFNRRFTAATVVRAENQVQTLHHAGGQAPEAGASGTSVGGTFTLVDRQNTTVAGVADGVDISTQRLDVTAHTTDWLISISPTSGKGAGVAANGMASYNKLQETTLASISREARVTAPSVNVDAELSLGVIAITGAVSRSENSGVGIGLAINDVRGNTRAYVGDNDADGGGANTDEGAAGALRTGALRVQARTDGMVVAVGVAGASAGEEPDPETPESPSTADNLADGVGADTADEQAQLDGSAATTAPLDEASEPAQGEGTQTAAAEEPAANKPPSFSIAGAGAIVTNLSDLDTTALLDGAVVRAIDAGTSTVAVRALSDLAQVSVAGGGALALSKNASTTFTAAVAGAVAVQKSDDDTTARVVNSQLSDLADQTDSLVLQALKSGERTAVATGISANLSQGSTTSVSLVGAASVTTSTDDTVATLEGSAVTGDATAPTALGVQVVAYDRSRLGAGGGALSVSTGKGAAGIGAAIAIVNANGSTQAQVSDGAIAQAHQLAVLALSSQKVVGAAAVGGVQANSDASSLGQLMGSFVYNHLDNRLSAGVNQGAVVNLSGDLSVQAGGAPSNASLDALLGAVRASDVTDYEMASEHNGYTDAFKDAVGGESVVGVAGTLSVTLGGSSSSLGLSYVHNDIQTDYKAEIVDSHISTGGAVSVAALSRADTVGVSAGLGATKGKFSGMGSASVNLMGQRTQATVDGGSVNAASLLVRSDTQGNTFALAGNLSFAVGAGQGNALGAAVAYTQTGTRTYGAGDSALSTRAAGNAARVDNTAVHVGAGAVQVLASNTSDVMSAAASGAAADGNVGFAGTVTANEMADVTEARISASSVTAGTVRVQAGEGVGDTSARIRSLAGGAAASKGYSGALALGFNTIDSTRSAQLLASTVQAGTSVSVLADAGARIETLSVALAGGKEYALAGSSSTNVLNGSTVAEVDASTLSGAATALAVRASQSGAIGSLAGAVSGAGTGAIGGAVAVNLMGQGSDDFKVAARLNRSVLAAPVAVALDARLSGAIQSVAASGSGAGTAAINGSISTNLIEAQVLAEVVDGSQTAAGGAFTVQADNQAAISSMAGTVSGAGTAAVGAAVAVNEIGGAVTARVQNQTLRATGAVDVAASSSGSVRAVAAGAAGSGTVALAGSNTTNAITADVLAQMDNVTQAVASASLRVQARDSATIQSLAGTVAGGGTATGGAAFSFNFLGRTATDADSSKRVRAEVLNSRLVSGGAVQVRALSSSLIESIGLAVGTGINGAVTGSNTTNMLEDETVAQWLGGSLNGAATQLTVQADAAATVRTLAGNVAGSNMGAVGAALAVNGVGSVVRASLLDATLGASVATEVDADLRGEIRSVAASGGAAGMGAVNGSFTTNALDAQVTAEVQRLNQTSTGTALAVRADNDADVFSLAGTIGGAGTAAAGVAVSVNAVGGGVTARLVDSTLRANGAVSVAASTSGRVESVAAGMAGGGSVGLVGSNTTNAITSTVLAQLSGVDMAVNAATLDVLARDSATIRSLAGSVAGGGVAGGGAALAQNFLGRTTTNAASSKVVKAEVRNSRTSSTGAVQVRADSTSEIGSVAVAAGASGTAGMDGSNATNLLEDEITASWVGTDLVTSGSLTVAARQAAQIDALAGNVSGSMGAAVGAALAVNRLGSDTTARLVGTSLANFQAGTGHWSVRADDVLLSAQSDNQIHTMAVGMSAGGVGVQGSVSVSVIDAQTHATLGADGQVTQVLAQDSVAVTANSHDRIRALAGAIGLGSQGVGAAGGLLTNIITSDTTAGINGLDTHVNALAHGAGLSVRGADLAGAPDLMNITELSDAVLDRASFTTRNLKGLAVQATSIQQLGALTAVAGGGALGAAGAAINVDQIGGSTRAYIDSAAFVNHLANAHADQAVDVLAANHAMVASSATALAIGAAGVSGAMGTEMVDRSTRAEVIDGAWVQAQGAASVKAVSSNAVAQISAGAAGGAVFGLAGSGDVVLLRGETLARVDAATLNADSIAVVADGSNASNLVAGAVSVAGLPGGTGVGLSFTVNVSGSTVRALVNDATLRADGAVVVDADNRTSALSASASAGVGGSFGAAVGASVAVMEGATEAAVTGSSTVGKRTRATGLVASANDAPVTINLASPYDTLGTGTQSALRLSLSGLTGRVAPLDAVVTVTDGVTTVAAVRQADGTYSANVASLDDGVLMAQVVLSEGGVQKVSTTTLLKSTGKSDATAALLPASLPAAQTRIATLSSFEEVDARNHAAVQFVLKSDTGLTADGAAVVTVSDGTRQVQATRNADGSYTADVRALGDGVLTALVTTPAGGTATTRLSLVKSSGAASLSVTADETVALSHNAGQLGAGGAAGVGASANVVVGKSTVDARVSASSIRVTGAVAVSAQRDADIDMVTATGGAGGLAGVSGAVGVLVFGAAPDSQANAELSGSHRTLGLVSGATQANRAQGAGGGLSAAEASALDSQAQYDTQGAYAGASGLHRTSATVAAQSLVAGSLDVKSLDRTEADNSAGAVALGGVAGVSAGVAITQLGGANHAGVSVDHMAIAGGVSLASGTRSRRAGAAVQSLAVAGAGGFVGVGAAVSVASNSTASTASLAGQLYAGGAVSVLALDESSMRSEAYGATAGGLAVGVVKASAVQSGSVGTQLSGSHSSQGLSAVAERNAAADALAKGGVAGVVAGSGAEALATDSGAVSLTLASGTVLDAGQGALNLAARANPRADTQALGVAVAAGAAVGVSMAASNVSTTVDLSAAGPVTLRGAQLTVAAVLGAGASSVRSEATAGAGALLLGATGAGATATNRGRARVNLDAGLALLSSGDVTLSATDSMAVHASALGVAVGAGFVGLGVADAQAVSNSTVVASATGVQGSVGGSLQVSASGNESIDSQAEAGAGGVVSGAGAQAHVDHDQSVSADLGVATGQTLRVGGRTTIDATRLVRYDAQTTAANAAAMGASGAVTRATLDGAASARLLDGSSLQAGSLRVLATNDLARTSLGAQGAVGGGGGVISGAGADVYTRLDGDATASIGHNATVLLEDLLELRAYNEMQGSSRAQMDVGAAVPIALVNTQIVGQANADAVVGNNTHINVYGETGINALSYLNLEAKSVSKTYGLAAAAQGNAYATADVNNRVTLGTGSELRSTEGVTLLAGQDLDFNRNKHFVTARADLFNHSAIPVSVDPDADARLNLNNALVVNAQAVRSGGTIQLGGVEGTYVVEGKSKVSDWTRDLGELVGLSSDGGSSRKTLSNTALLHGAFEAGFGNKQRLVVGVDGTVLESEGDVRYSITNEDLSASASAYVERLYDQLARYGDVPEVRAFVEAELSFYFATLLKEGLAEEMTMEDGTRMIVASSGVAANFLNIKDLRAGSGNIELFGNDVSGSAELMARADSEIYIENRSPLNLRVFDMVVDANGGFAKYNGTYLMNSADIGALNKTTKTTGLSVDSIDTRGGGSTQLLPKLTVKNTYVASGSTSANPLLMTAPDGTWADLREDQVRAPELRVNGWLYNKLGTVNLSNTAGSISVYAEDPAYVPRLDGKEIVVSSGKNFVLSSPTISQSVGGSPESLYAVHYSDDQLRTLNNLGISACGSARPGGSPASYNANCLVNGAGGVYASGAIFIGARYLNINGTVQSGQADYNVVLSNASVGTQIANWRSTWLAQRGTFLAQGRSSLIQLSGPLPTDNEADINKQYASGTLTATARANALAAMATRRLQPIVFYDAEANVLKVAPTNVQGGLVELVGSIINTGGGVVRALDGYARINIDNQTDYGLDLQGLDTGGDAGLVRITDLSKPIKNADGSIRAYAVTSYQRDTDGKFKAKVTEGTGVGAALIATSGSLIASPDGQVKARFNYSPLANSTYSWSAGYEFMTERRYYYKSSSFLGFIPGGSVKWDSVDTFVKTANAMVEDVYVGTNVPLGGGNFSVTTQRVSTDAEKEIYYRSWRKCGFLCVKKTYYVDRRTEAGLKDIFTQRVAADHDIKVELVGYDSGVLNVKSVGSIRLGGNMTNDSGTVSLQSVNGAISQLNSGAVVQGVNLSFQAKTGIGTEVSPINLITGTGSFTAESQSGPVSVRGTSGALRINKVSTSGNVWLDGDGSIVGLDPSAVHVRGNRIYLSAPRGNIGEFNADGSVKSTLNIDTGDSTNGGLSAYARQGVAIKETTGNLWVNQVATGGDVYLAAPGDLIDNNRNETRDERTEAELLALWDQAALQGPSAEASRQLTLTTTRAQYRRYWSLRGVRDVVTDAHGNVTSYQADPVAADYRYRFDADLRQQYLDNGISEAQIAAMEAAQTAEVLKLHAEYGTTSYQTGNDQVIAAVNAANQARGKAEVGALAEWSDAELKSPLPKAVFAKSTTDTQTRIEEPNVVGNRVVLRPGGQIGRDDGQVVIPLLRATRVAQGLVPELSADERLAIMSAESDDMSLDRNTWTLTVVKKDTFNVLSNRLNVDSNGFVYLGADTTESYPNGGTANLEMVKGTGEIRIKVADSILSVAAAGVSVIQGQKAILEAANGSIGSAAKPVQMALANNSSGTLTARASEGIWLHSVGDLRAADVYTPGSAYLSATGAIIDARPVVNYPDVGDRTSRSIEASDITLNALGGAVGSGDNPMVLKMGADGVNASSALGYSIWLRPAEGSDLVLRSVNAGLDVSLLSPYGDLTHLSAVTARRSIFAEAEGDITGLMYTAGGDVVLAAGGDLTGSKVAAGSGTASLVAGGDVALTSLSSNLDAAVSAGGGIGLTSGSAGRDLRLNALQGGIQGVSWRAGNSLLATAGGQGDIRATTVSATKGTVRLIGGGDVSATLVSALGAVELSAVRGMSLLNVTSTGAGLTLTAGNALSLLAARAKTDVVVQAGAGVQASSLTSSSARVLASTRTGDLSAQTVTAAQGATLAASAGSLDLGTVTTKAGGLDLTAGATMTVSTASAPGSIVARAGQGMDLRTVSSSAAQVDLVSEQGALRVSTLTAKTTVKADAVLGALSVGAFSGVSAVLGAGSTLSVTGSGKTTGSMVLDSGDNMTLGALTSTANTIQARAGGTLTAKDLQASGELVLLAGTGLSATQLGSTSSRVSVSSDAGSVTVSSATARTQLAAHSGGDLTLGSFTVGSGSASFTAAGALRLSKGTARDNIGATSVGHAALGSLTASTGTITAQSTNGGLTFATLKAATGITMDAAKAWSVGNAVSGSALTVTRGTVNVLARSGHVVLGTLSVGTLATTPNTTLKTLAGSIKLGKVLGLKAAQLDVQVAGGSKTLPKGYD